MKHTPLPLPRVIPDASLAVEVEKFLDTLHASAAEAHGITIWKRKGTGKHKHRALVFWGDFLPEGDRWARGLRKILGDEYCVSQCRRPEGWGKFFTATVEDPDDY